MYLKLLKKKNRKTLEATGDLIGNKIANEVKTSDKIIPRYRNTKRKIYISSKLLMN